MVLQRKTEEASMATKRLKELLEARKASSQEMSVGIGSGSSIQDEDIVNIWNLRKCTATPLGVISNAFGDEIIPTLMPLIQDLTNPILPKAIKAFGSLNIRIGGSLEDQIYYKVGKFANGCPDLRLSSKGFLFGFSHGCLDMARWDQAYNLLNRSKGKITFGLNTLIGRKKLTEDSLYEGDWVSSNARDCMYILSKGQQIDSWELALEACGKHKEEIIRQLHNLFNS